MFRIDRDGIARSVFWCRPCTSPPSVAWRPPDLHEGAVCVDEYGADLTRYGRSQSDVLFGMRWLGRVGSQGDVGAIATTF